MNRTDRTDRKPAFTLVELMTVVAIIGLLIGILVPALSAARTQAKKASTQAQLDSISKGCLMFQSDGNDKLPRSRGANPFETYSAQNPVTLSGAQWLTLQLSGADLQGYVKDSLQNDAPAAAGAASVGKIDAIDWLDWYKIEPSRKYARARYVEIDGRRATTPDQYAIDAKEAGLRPQPLAGNADGGTGGTSDWHNGKLPFYVDAFGYPILYYAATPGVERPITTGVPSGSSFVPGIYDMSDNVHFTGSKESVGRFPVGAGSVGWDIAGRGLPVDGTIHYLGKIGYELSGGVPPTTWPEPGTFAAAIMNRSVYETTKRSGGAGGEQGKLWPHNPDNFIMFSAGPDGLYGSDDDIRNFQAKD